MFHYYFFKLNVKDVALSELRDKVLVHSKLYNKDMVAYVLNYSLQQRLTKYSTTVLTKISDNVMVHNKCTTKIW